MVGLHFVELFDNSRVVDRKTTKSSERLCSLIILVPLDEVSWSLREDEQSGIR
jgi:hypothetical protein